MRLSAILSAVLVVAGTSHGLIWPVLPNDSVQPLGNNWGNFQFYGTPPAYMHEGIDIMTPGRVNAPVVAVSHGWVKTWGTEGGDLYWAIYVCDSPPTYTGRAPGWDYGHIDSSMPHVGLGDEVFEGDTIGYVVDWPLPVDFDHLHFARVSDSGEYWMRYPRYEYAWYIENPLPLLEPRGDTIAPVIENALGAELLAFCVNEDTIYLDPGNLRGRVDIVAKIHDCTGYPCGKPVHDKLAPYRIEHMIKRAVNDSVVRPWTLSVEFSNRLYYPHTYVVYKRDNTCLSRGTWYSNEYYYIITNTDGDSIIEFSDSTGCWDTELVPDGAYWVLVRASDHVGNTTTDSMLVACSGIQAGDPRRLLASPLCVQPNPGPGPLVLSFALQTPAYTRLRVIDPAGRVVSGLVDRMLGSGQHRFQTRLPAGVYLVQAEFDGRSRQSVKVVVTE